MSKTPITLNFVNLARPSFSKSKPRNGNVNLARPSFSKSKPRNGNVKIK